VVAGTTLNMIGSRLSGIGMTSARTRDRLIQRLRDQGITDLRVLERIRHVPRHIFVDEALSSRAYEDTALPIGFSQTISQPYIVARMTAALLAGGPLKKVLEVGTGCGYQTAVLAPLVGKIYSLERIQALQTRAARHLRELGIQNVLLKHGDGLAGWKSQAPFDGIIAAAAPLSVPEALLKQLAKGGRLIVPVGPEGEQRLWRIVRGAKGLEQQLLGPVSFVPMLGGVT
jgi:protein-L-isoaspartate(D-aspartate) O-methyltransferase